MALRSGLSVVSMCLAAPIQHVLGPLRTYQLGMASWPFAISALPIMSAMARQHGENVIELASFKIMIGMLMFAWSLAGLTWRTGLILFPTPFG